MNQLLLHGPAINSSRQKFLEIRKKFPPDNVIVFGKEADEKDVVAVLQTTSLFEGERLVIWENPPENIISNLSLVTSSPREAGHLSLVLWFDHEVDATKFKDTQVYFFPEAREVSVFPFLDYLGNRDKGAYLELDKLKKEYDSQYIITMILYLLRNLVVTPKGVKEFVRKKNEKMRKNFTLEELIKLYRNILEIDFKIKSGFLEKLQAEFLLVNLFTH